MLYNSGNVTYSTAANSFASIADAMTNYIRQHGDAANIQAVFGSVNRTGTCVDVRWGWIAYPAILFVLTVVFFVSMLWQTSRVPSNVAVNKVQGSSTLR